MSIRKTLAKILEFAKMQRDFSNSKQEEDKWKRIVELSFYGLGKPSMIEVNKILREK